MTVLLFSMYRHFLAYKEGLIVGHVCLFPFILRWVAMEFVLYRLRYFFLLHFAGQGHYSVMSIQRFQADGVVMFVITLVWVQVVCIVWVYGFFWTLRTFL